MGTVLELNAQPHFGDCPKCKSNDGHINVGRDHWFVCKKHRVKWKGGHDMFPDWKNETLSIWRTNEKMLDLFMEIEPFHAGKFTTDEELFADPGRNALLLSLVYEERQASREPERNLRLVQQGSERT
jgi:hypothetical protein